MKAELYGLLSKTTPGFLLDLVSPESNVPVLN
jgi:hypothetical protein